MKFHRLTLALCALFLCTSWPAMAEPEVRSGPGAIDFNVRPDRAEVWIDGEFVGLVDEFDGLPDFLWLPEGTYDVAVYLPGFETLARQISLNPGEINRFRDRMERGESRHPDDLGPTSTERRDERIRRNREREAQAAMRERLRDRDYQIGRLVIDVGPPDAVVYLDGEFLGVAEELAYLEDGVVVTPGEHAVEVARPGYRSEKHSVVVALGERVDLEFVLHRD